MYEILIKGGKVIDPAQKIYDHIDVGISQGKIAALARGIAPGEAKKVVDAKGMIVSPGIIDFHCHVTDGIVPNGAPPDQAGVLSGVTALGDGGSTGYANFGGFRRFVIAQSRTDVRCFLHVSSTGIAFMPEIWSWHNINTEETLKTIEENRDIIKGVKLRAIWSVVENLGVEAVKVAKRLATEARLPLMVHIGPDLDELGVAAEDTMSAFIGTDAASFR